MRLSDHAAWASKRFKRIDRKGRGLLFEEDLYMQPFLDSIKEAIGMKGPANAALSSAGLFDWIRRMNPQSCGHVLDLEGFSSLTWKLKHLSDDAGFESKFVFALFDGDGDGKINFGEFKEMYRFFTKAAAPTDSVLSLWEQLDRNRLGYVTIKQYVGWLQGFEISMSMSHSTAPPRSHLGGKTLLSMFKAFKKRAATPSPHSWYSRHHITDSACNIDLPPNLRGYFNRPRSEYCTAEGRSRLLGHRSLGSAADQGN